MNWLLYLIEKKLEKRKQEVIKLRWKKAYLEQLKRSKLPTNVNQ